MAQKAFNKADMLENPEELQKHAGKMVYILIYSDAMVGSTTLVDVNKYMAEDDLLDTYADDPTDFTLLHGLVLNVEELPIEMPDDLPEDYSLYVVKHDNYTSIEIEEANDFEAVAEYIEFALEDDVTDNMNISDFAVIYARKVPFILQAIAPDNEINQERKAALGVS